MNPEQSQRNGRPSHSARQHILSTRLVHRDIRTPTDPPTPTGDHHPTPIDPLTPTGDPLTPIDPRTPIGALLTPTDPRTLTGDPLTLIDPRTLIDLPILAAPLGIPVKLTPLQDPGTVMVIRNPNPIDTPQEGSQARVFRGRPDILLVKRPAQGDRPVAEAEPRRSNAARRRRVRQPVVVRNCHVAASSPLLTSPVVAHTCNNKISNNNNSRATVALIKAPNNSVAWRLNRMYNP